MVARRSARTTRPDRVLLLCAGLFAALGLVMGTAGCEKPVAPHVAATSTTIAEAGPTHETGIDKDKFNKAWDQVKEIVVATSVAAALPALAEQVSGLRELLDAVPTAGLNPDEQTVLAAFDRVYWAYADGVALWTALMRAEKDHGGIPLLREGVPLFPRADVIAALYGLTLERSAKDPVVECVAESSIDKLWEVAYRAAQNELLPVFGR